MKILYLIHNDCFWTQTLQKMTIIYIYEYYQPDK